MMRHWTKEEREKQASLIRGWQPWLNSTGAKSLAGKEISSHNAYKGGIKKKLQELQKALSIQKNLLK